MDSPDKVIPKDGGYAFHDPEFVEWWLRSLYMLSPDDQVGIARAMSERIQVPAVKTVCAEFIALFGSSVVNAVATDTADEPPALKFDPSADRFTQASQVATAKFAEIWAANRKLIVLAGIGIVFFVGKGLVTLWSWLSGLV